MMKMRVAIVGAGITGLACARDLVAAGLEVVVFDKGRGVGGRLATRRAEGGFQFDHGASQVSATGAPFAALLKEAEAAGALACWEPGAGTSDASPSFVGLPGMSGFARYLAQGIDVRVGSTVGTVDRVDVGWRVTVGDHSETFDRVVLTLPAPQIIRLLGTTHPLSKEVSGVQMSPCLTLMAAFAGQGHVQDQKFAQPPGDLDIITLENSKPGRQGDLQLWVAHANADFSNRHLDQELPDIAQMMLPLLCDHLGRKPAEALHAVAHRWRYARASRPLGLPFLSDRSGQMYLGGDWCLGNTAEAGWTSGRAVAADLLALGR